MSEQEKTILSFGSGMLNILKTPDRNREFTKAVHKAVEANNPFGGRVFQFACGAIVREVKLELAMRVIREVEITFCDKRYHMTPNGDQSKDALDMARVLFDYAHANPDCEMIPWMYELPEQPSSRPNPEA
jgi:hypothetical protein